MKLLFLGSEHAFDLIRSRLPEYEVYLAQTVAGVEKHIEICDVILDGWLKVRFTKELLMRASNLKLFVVAATGEDHIDQEELSRRSIPLLSLKQENELLKSITPTAELAWLLLMACARRLPSAIKDVLQGGWNRDLFPGTVLKGKILGIIGYGRLGQWMARYAAAFEMTVLAYDPYLEIWRAPAQQVKLDVLLRRSDFISIHVPLNEETRGLIDTSFFESVKAGVILINTSRGAVIDEGALLEALVSGRVAAAGLDVLHGEPDVRDHPLIRYAREHDNLIITPHIGGYCPEVLNKILVYFCNKITNFFHP